MSEESSLRADDGTGAHTPQAHESRDEPVDHPVVDSRWKRLSMYVRHNADRLVVDAAILLAWIVGSTFVFQLFGLPQWLHYLVLLVGIVVYARVTPDWERPYRSPD